jgi:hypothetical protein
MPHCRGDGLSLNLISATFSYVLVLELKQKKWPYQPLQRRATSGNVPFLEKKRNRRRDFGAFWVDAMNLNVMLILRVSNYMMRERLANYFTHQCLTKSIN